MCLSASNPAASQVRGGGVTRPRDTPARRVATKTTTKTARGTGWSRMACLLGGHLRPVGCSASRARVSFDVRSRGQVVLHGQARGVGR